MSVPKVHDHRGRCGSLGGQQGGDRGDHDLAPGRAAVPAGEGSPSGRAEADARWRELSTSTDRDDVTATDLDPLGHRSLR